MLAVLRGDESRVLLKDIDDVSPIMRQAIVSVEDRRFYEHNGVDRAASCARSWQDIRSQAVVEGGSTITQQFVKNAYVRNQQTIARKVREAALAWQLEQRWPKDRILLAYLNTIYFGNGAYGIQQAARTYFGKGAGRLTLPEAALLAGLPADPSLYDPTQHPAAAHAAARTTCCRRCTTRGKITDAELATRDASAAAEAGGRPAARTRRGPGQYFVNYVKDQLIAKYGAGRVFGGGLKVTSTIDLELQETAHKAIESVLKRPGGPAAALVAIDPRTGAVRAMVGGSNFRESQFNLATQAERQPGSSFKPIVLATALRQGISPVTRFDSKPVDIDAGDRVWHVTNYEGDYLGRVDLARGDGLLRQLGLRPADEARRAEGDRQDRARARDPQRARRVLLDRPRRRRRQPARHDARLRDVREPRRARRRLADGRPAAGRRARRVRAARARRARTAGRQGRCSTPARPTCSPRSSQSVVEQGTGARASSRTGRLPARPARPTTTATRGSSATRPSSPSPSGSATRTSCKPMLTEFGGKPVAGGTLPALIWKAFMTARREQRADRAVPVDAVPPGPEKRIVWRGGRGKLDNGYCPGTRVVAYFAGRAARLDRGRATRTRCRCPLVVGRTVDVGASALASEPLAPR